MGKLTLGLITMATAYTVLIISLLAVLRPAITPLDVLLIVWPWGLVGFKL